MTALGKLPGRAVDLVGAADLELDARLRDRCVSGQRSVPKQDSAASAKGQTPKCLAPAISSEKT